MNLKIEINRNPDSHPNILVEEALRSVFAKQMKYWGMSADGVNVEFLYQNQSSSKLIRLHLDGVELQYSITLASEVWFVSQQLIPDTIMDAYEVMLDESEVKNRMINLLDEGNVISFYEILFAEIVKENIDSFLSPETCPPLGYPITTLDHPQKIAMLISIGRTILRNLWSLKGKLPAIIDCLETEPAESIEKIAEKILDKESPSIRIYVSESHLRSLPENFVEDDASAFKKTDVDLYYLLGIDFPDPQILMDATLKDHHFRIQINDRQSMLYEGIYDEKSLRKGMTTTKLLLMNLKVLLRKHAASFITTFITQQYLSIVEQSFPDLVAAVRNKRSIEFISQVLRVLVSEGISLRNFDSILQSILDFDFIPIDGSSLIVFDDRVPCSTISSREPENSSLLTAEYARIQLKRHISHLFTGADKTLSVHLLAPEIEKMVMKGMSQQEQFNFLEAINLKVSPAFFYEGKYYPILTNVNIRSTVKEICQKRFPELPVIGFQELSPDYNIQPISRISMD